MSLAHFRDTHRKRDRSCQYIVPAYEEAGNSSFHVPV